MQRISWLCAAIVLGVSAPAFSETADAAPDGRLCAANTPLDARIEACTSIIAAGEKSQYSLAFAYRTRCLAFVRKRHFDRAIADCDQAIKLDRNDAEAFRVRCLARNEMAEFDRAIPDCDEAIRLDANLAAAYSDRCWALFEAGYVDRAISDCDRAIRLNPNLSDGYNNRARALKAKGDVDRALADLDQAIRVGPRNSRAYNNRGNIWREKRDYDRAIADFDESIRLEPTYATAYANRGLSYEAKGDFERARADFNSALTHSQKGDLAKWADFLTRERSGGKVPATAPAPSKPQVAVASPVTGKDAKAAVVAPSGRRVALVIGNSNYSTAAALPNATRDAEAIAASLRRVGFQTSQHANLRRAGLIDALRAFAADAEKAEWALIYFAGHGIEIDGVNYLVPVDANLATDRDVRFEAVPLDQVLGAVEGARRLRLVLLDACRDNPFTQMRKTVASRSIGKGLASVEPEAGTLVVYAAKHGQVALDGEGANSPFVSALVKRLETPGLEVRRLFDHVRDDVMEATGRLQQPFSYGSVPGREDFYFVANR